MVFDGDPSWRTQSVANELMNLTLFQRLVSKAERSTGIDPDLYKCCAGGELEASPGFGRNFRNEKLDISRELECVGGNEEKVALP